MAICCIWYTALQAWSLSTLAVFVDYPQCLCFADSPFQHYTLPLIINPPKWFIFSSWHSSSICHAYLYLSEPPPVVPIIFQVPGFSCHIQFNRLLVASLLWQECTGSGNYIYSLPTTYIIYFECECWGGMCGVQPASTVVQSDCSTIHVVLAGVCAVQATSAVRFVAGAITPVHHTFIVQSWCLWNHHW